MFSGESVCPQGEGYDVTSCLVPCSFQEDLPPGGVGTPPGLTSSGGHCSGRYASCWNAFLFDN